MVRSVMGRCAACATAVLVVALSFTGNAAGTTITFDELAKPDYVNESPWPYAAPIPGGYGGLHWQDMWYIDATKSTGGYSAGLKSGEHVAFNAEAKVASASATPFFLNSAWFTAATVDTIQLVVEGYLDQALAGSMTATLSKTAPTLITFNWTVDLVSFAGIAPGGTSAWFALDNLMINEPLAVAAPLPAAAWGGVTLLGLIGIKRRRRPV